MLDCTETTKEEFFIQIAIMNPGNKAWAAVLGEAIVLTSGSSTITILWAEHKPSWITFVVER